MNVIISPFIDEDTKGESQRNQVTLVRQVTLLAGDIQIQRVALDGAMLVGLGRGLKRWVLG